MNGNGDTHANFPLPFDGALSRYFETDFPKKLREQVEKAKDKEVLAPAYPYEAMMDRDDYDKAFDRLQIELQKLQRWVRTTGARILILFEGRDAAGKGGTIARITRNMNPRGARVVALSKPSDVERGQWYFQRYAPHLPSPGELVLFDRSWYNRAGVETVMGFCTPEDRSLFFRQVPSFERMLVDDGIYFFKIWLSVSRAEQMRRFLAREKDPLKQWKLSPIDVAALEKWEDYTTARDAMFDRTHTPEAPWSVIRSDCKRRARLTAIQTLLHRVPYEYRDHDAIGDIDRGIEVSPDRLEEIER
ncbi:MAG: polyphosphate kinase 2 [Pseudomonadota bacterium]